MHNTETRWTCERCGRIQIAERAPEGWLQMTVVEVRYSQEEGQQTQEICGECAGHYRSWWLWGQPQRHVEQVDMCGPSPDSRHLTTEGTGYPSGTTSLGLGGQAVS